MPIALRPRPRRRCGRCTVPSKHRIELLGSHRIETGIIQANVGSKNPKNGLRSARPSFEGLHVLRSGIAPPIRGLVIGTVCRTGLLARVFRPWGCRIGLTIAIHGAVCARLLTIALDLFAAALVTGAGDPSPLLRRRKLFWRLRRLPLWRAVLRSVGSIMVAFRGCRTLSGWR